MNHEIISTSSAPAALGPYSQGIKAGSFIFTAGQVGIDPSTGKLVEGIEGQTRQVLSNLQAILAAAGSTFDQVVKTTIFLQDIADFARVNAIYGQAFAGKPPARATVQVAGLPLGALVEIEAIAHCVE